MTASNDHQSEQSYANWMLKFVGLSVGFVYSLGFLVVARHLSRFGVSSFSVLQLHYLVAGVWTLSPPIAFALVQGATQRFTDKAWRSGPAPFSWHRLILIPAVTGIPFGFLIGAYSLLLGGFEGLTWGIGSRLWLFYLIMAVPADLAWLSWRVPEGSDRRWINRHATPFYVTLFVLGIVLYALYFAVRIYPLIPSSLGGGNPRSVVFISGEKQLPAGILKDSTPGRSIPYKLLTVTDRSYIVISPASNEDSIEINRDAVQGMVVLKDSNSP